MQARVTSGFVGWALGRVVLNGWENKAFILSNTLVESRRRSCWDFVVRRHRLRVLRCVIGIGLVLGRHDEPTRRAVSLIWKHDKGLRLSVNGPSLRSLLVLLVLAKRSIGVTPRRLGGGDMNTWAGRNARELGNVEVFPVWTSGILSLMLYVASLVAAGSVHHRGRVQVRILGVHAVIEHHALVETSVRGVVVSVIVLGWMTVLLIVLVSHRVVRRVLAMVSVILLMWVLRIVRLVHGATVRLIVSVGRTIWRMIHKLACVHFLRMRRVRSMVARSITPASIVDRSLLAFNSRSQMTLVCPRCCSVAKGIVP
mmetsp:Transcript_10406/g.22026  ORF Transcript_10406/g.22026 Transcript_10406/m.22026 type:complete len:312 (+) Transcript_10406:248-1183(+)